ncbi:MAG: carboxypeptidase regulatory-like domain-containing protein, partial [Myxococcaceae bacterium]|nr:carboxypeptidase regulatory-like domain-containing protein [Myxococcaceae bacterium]
RFVADARGEVRFHAAEDAWLEARHPDFTPGAAEVTPMAVVAREVVVRLPRREGPLPLATASLAGRVVDAAGGPVAGAAVHASLPLNAPPSRADAVLPEALTDEDGRFRLESLAPGLYDVTAWRAELAPARLEGVAAGREDLVLTLREGVRLEGTVRDVAGTPIPSFTLSVQRRVGPLQRTGWAEQAVVDAEGRYVLRGLLPGSYAVQVAAHGHAPAERALEVTEGASSPLRADFTLSEGARLSGQVVEAKTEKPLERARIQVEGLLGGGSLAVRFDALTDAQGTFSLSGLAPGEMSLYVAADGHHHRILSGIAVREGAPAFQRIELRPVKEGESPQLELVGIGAVLSAREDALVLGEVLAGGGAAEAGLVTGDAIVKVDGVPVVELGFQTAVQRIRGPENSRVLLGVRRPGTAEVVDVPVTRRRIQL